MSSVLAINGSTVNRVTARVVLNRLSLSMDTPDTLEFTEKCVALPGTYRSGQSVTLTVDGTLRFTGVIVSLHPHGMGRTCIDIGYRCFGLNWLANQVFITSGDGSGKIVYNLPSTDPDYIPSMSGLTVGQILKKIYDLHSAQLTAVGVTAYSGTELSNLTVVPPDPVTVTGRLWSSVQELLANWHNKYGAWITADGTIHHPNMLTLATNTLTLNTDPIILESISEDFSECYTQVIVRGADDVQGAYLSLHDKTLTAKWTATQQTNWTFADFVQPKGGYELGTINSMTSTTLTVHSLDPASISYGTAHWAPLNAEVWAYVTGGSEVADITFSEQRRITANTAPSSNIYTLTVDTAFNNSGYNTYQIRGMYAAQSLTWRAFNVVPSWVSDHLVKRLSHSVPWAPSDGVLLQTMTPMADVCYTQGGIYTEWPMTFQIVPSDLSTACTTKATVTATISAGAVTGFTSLSGGAGYPPSQSDLGVYIVGGGGAGATAHAASNSSGVITSVTLDAGGSGYATVPNVSIGVQPGYIVFDQPICAAYTSQTNMNLGGTHVSAPTDLKVLVPYSRGAITATRPTSSYEGTAYTVNGVTRTLYRDYPQWLDYADAANYLILAQEILDTVKNTVVEGDITYFGKYSTAFTLGQSLNIAGSYTTGYEAIAAPIRGVVLDYCPDGGASPWITRMSFSTRLKPFCGDRIYAHSDYGSTAQLGSTGYWNPASAAAQAASLKSTREAYEEHPEYGLSGSRAAAALDQSMNPGDPMQGLWDTSQGNGDPYIPDEASSRSGRNLTAAEKQDQVIAAEQQKNDWQAAQRARHEQAQGQIPDSMAQRSIPPDQSPEHDNVPPPPEPAQPVPPLPERTSDTGSGSWDAPTPAQSGATGSGSWDAPTPAQSGATGSGSWDAPIGESPRQWGQTFMEAPQILSNAGRDIYGAFDKADGGNILSDIGNAMPGVPESVSGPVQREASAVGDAASQAWKATAGNPENAPSKVLPNMARDLWNALMQKD